MEVVGSTLMCIIDDDLQVFVVIGIHLVLNLNDASFIVFQWSIVFYLPNIMCLLATLSLNNSKEVEFMDDIAYLVVNISHGLAKYFKWL